MGLTVSEIAINTLPCCCDNNINIATVTEIEDIDNESKQSFIDDASIGDSTDKEMEDMEDDFMADPHNRETESVIVKMSWDVMDASEDLWNALDQIFFSYQSDVKLVNSIKSDEEGLKQGLEIILDDYTQNQLYNGVKNYSTHKRKHKFDITKTMAVADYVPSAYQTEPLWFYEDKSYGLVTAKMECDIVCPYECADGSKYVANPSKGTRGGAGIAMECDNSDRHRNYPISKDRCLLQLQYISFGCIDSKYHKTRNNYYNYRENKWCFQAPPYEIEAGDVDYECTIIAFSSYGQHYTSKYSYDKPSDNGYGNGNNNNNNNSFMRKKMEFLNAVQYINDVSYLKQYAVRSGYNKYGALAYFNSDQKILAIQTYWDNRIWMKPNNLKDKKYLKDWQYAKWVWKTSVVISSYLYEWIAKCRFREINSFIQTIHTNLNMNHCIRRLFKPFIYGTVSANDHFKTLCQQYGLFHRIFGFQYNSFCKLLNDGMQAYRFKILLYKFKKLKDLSPNSCPGYTDFESFWHIIHKFVSGYFEIYYGQQEQNRDDFLFNKDPKLKKFYSDIVNILGIDSKYRYKRFNVINLITHFICTVTIYNKHLNEAISWDGIFLAKLFYPQKEYLWQSYSGCAIRSNNQNMSVCSENDVLSYTEYVLLIVNNGIKEKNFDLKTIWSLIILKDDCRQECIKLFAQTQKNLVNLEKEIQIKNKKRRIPYNACCVSYLQSSACL